MVMEVEVTSELDIPGRRIRVSNMTDIPMTEIAASADMREVANQLSRWVDNARAATGRTSMFDRGAYTPPANPYNEMRSAKNAVQFDSVVSGVAEQTEAFAFEGVKWESQSPDEADAFNQLARDQNLDALVRGMWREEYTYGSFVCAKLWGEREYTVRGKTKDGNKRKKTFVMWAPLQMRLLDPLKVVPVGVGPLGGETLAWSATAGEIGHYGASLRGEVIDPLMMAFFQGKYIPDYEEQAELAALGVDTSRLLEMSPEWVFRHTITKPDYQRFPDIRLKSCFKLLDLKQQLMAADRAALIGSANYILLIKKGTEKQPAQPAEMDNLRENFNLIAKMPVIISDHRLEIEIVAPKSDFILKSEAYEIIDQRLVNRLLGTLWSGGKNSGRSDNQDTMAETLGRMMENRRHMLKRTLEIQIARAIVQHPRNRDVFEYEPNLVYTPRRIGIAQNQAFLSNLMALRTQREISRETILEVFGLDEETEALRMVIEEERFDDIFKTEIPYSKGAPAQDIDANLDSKDTPQSFKLTVGPDGTVSATPDAGAAPAKTPAKTPAKAPTKTPAKAPAKVAKAPVKAPAKATPNGTPESPKVSGSRGGRPVGGGGNLASPARIAKPKTRAGNPSTKKG